jgi:hypothetical protein
MYRSHDRKLCRSLHDDHTAMWLLWLHTLLAR